jgi:hypothetical protein
MKAFFAISTISRGIKRFNASTHSKTLNRHYQSAAEISHWNRAERSENDQESRGAPIFTLHASDSAELKQLTDVKRKSLP